MKILIRNAKEEEIEKISELNILAWNKAFSKFLLKSTIMKFKLEDRINFFKERFYSDKSQISIALDRKNGEIIGFIAMDIINNTSVEVVSFYIDPEYYKEGVGERLFLELKKYCIHNKIHNIFTWIFKNNIDGINFYKKMGFYQTDFERNSRLEYDQIELQFIKKI